jgi:hypothetical protein
VEPAQLERFSSGSTLRVVDVGVGLAYNTAALLEAAQSRGLRLQWWGLELDRRPLAIALADRQFRELWRPHTVELLDQLLWKGCWQAAQSGAGEWWLGDARRMLPQLLDQNRGRCDLVLHDALSPGRCPQLWTLEFRADLAGLLQPQGLLLTYSAAAAVRQGLLEAGLHLASLGDPNGRAWSLGTAASPTPLPLRGALRALGPLELEHLNTRAAEPYRDPGRNAPAETILAARAQAQAGSGAGSTGAWRRRWAAGRGEGPLSSDANLRSG